MSMSARRLVPSRERFLSAAGARRLIAACVVVALFPLTLTAPAAAATLTSTSYTASNTLTGTAGVRDDWGFTTATTATLSKVTMGMPTGTTGGNRYLALGGTGTNRASTPDSPANSIAGDIDIRVKASLTAWSGAPTYQALVSKWNTGNQGYILRVENNGVLGFYWSTTGSDSPSSVSTVPTGFAHGATGWVRVTLQVNNGSNGSTTTFYTSADGTTWTQLGSPVINSGVTSIFDSSFENEIGSYGAGTGEAAGKIYYADVRNVIGANGVASNCASVGIVSCFNPNNDTVGGSSWTSSYPTTESWSIIRAGATPLADIASDLSVAKVTGLPAGGTANYRSIDNLATYYLPSATSVPAATVVTVGLMGFTNTNTAGSYTSAITTYDNSTPVVSIDTATTAAVVITSNTISTAFGNAPDYTSATAVANVSATLPIGVAIYGTTMYVADDYTNVVLKVNMTTGMATRYAGVSGIASYAGDGGLATSAYLNTPERLAVDSSGNLYIADYANNRIRKVTASSGNITTVAGNGTAGSAGDGAAATSANLSNPQGVAVASNGDIYIADSGNNKVRKVDHTTGYISTVAGTGTYGYSGDGGAATSATFKTPIAVNLDNNGDVYISDYTNAEVRKLTLSTGNISSFVGNGTCAYSGDGAAATAAQLCSPDGVVFATNGDAYVADNANNRIRKVTASTGFISTVAGNGSGGYSGDGGASTSAVLNYPRSPVLDASGNLYIADYNNSRVREIAGGNITTYMGTGLDTNSGDGGPASAAKFDQPLQLATDTAGNTYVADSGNNRVRKIDQWGIVTTFAGASTRVSSGNSGDGAAATAAKLHSPQGVAVTANGDVYIADTSNNAIRKVDHITGYISTFASVTGVNHLTVNPVTGDLYGLTNTNACQVFKITMAAVQTTVAGTGSCGYNVAAATDPTTVALNNPRDVTFDTAGNLYIADKDNNRIRKIDVSTGALTTVAGGGASTANNVAATAASLSGPRSVIVDALGNIYEFEDGHSNVREFRDGGAISTVAGSGTGYSGDGGSAVAATLTGSNEWLAILRGQLDIASYYSGVIRKVADIAPMAPNVNADSMSVAMNTPLAYPVESNDWDQDGAMDPNSVAITTAPAHGTAVVNITQGSVTNVTYTPTTSYTGSDSFTYQACDSTLILCGTATVSVTVGSNQVTTVLGALTEGDGSIISFAPANVTRFRNYLFFADSSYGVIRRYDTYSKQLVVVAGNGAVGYSGTGGPATAAGVSANGMAVAPNGSLYFADATDNRIRSISASGTITDVAGTGGAAYPTAGVAATATTLNAPAMVTFDSFGNVYCAMASEVWSFPLGGTMSLVAGTTNGASGDGGAATAAQLSVPKGIVFAPDGDLFISDSGNNAIRRVHGGIITTVAGTLGSAGSTGNGGAATSALLSYPEGITVDSAGNLTFADYSNSAIRTFTDGGTISAPSATAVAATDVVSGANAGELWPVSAGASRAYREYGGTIAPITNAANNRLTFSGDGLLGTATQISPDITYDGLAVDPSGNLYYNDFNNNRLRRLDATTHLVSTYAGDGGTTYSATSIVNGAGGLVFDASGNPVFYSGSRIRRRNSDGSLTNLAGTGVCAFSGDGGLATSAGICGNGLAYDGQGNLFLADSNNNRVRRIDHTTGIITTVVGTGTAASTGDGGLATAATLSSPRGLVFDGAGNMYVSEIGSGNVRMIDTSGYITTLATGQNNPEDLVIDADDNLYYPSRGGQTVNKTSVGGGTAVVAGSGTAGFTDNTTYTSAQLNRPDGIAISGSDLYVSDANNNRVRKITGIAATATNNLKSASWTIAPPASGHPNLREQFSFTPSATTTSSKITFTMLTGIAGTPSVVSAYGITGSVSASLSGTTLTVSYPSQTLTAGVPVSFAIEGWTNGGTNGARTSNTTLYDSAGTTAIGWARSNIVNISAAGAPASTDPGYSSVWMPSTTVTPSASSVSVNVNPASLAAASAAMTVTTGGNQNGNSFGIGASALTRTATPFSTFSAVSGGIGTGVAAGSFGADTWGSSALSTSGTVQGGAASGNYVGNTVGQQTFVTGASATNTFTLSAQAKVDWLLPAGTYTSTVTYALSPGT